MSNIGEWLIWTVVVGGGGDGRIGGEEVDLVICLIGSCGDDDGMIFLVCIGEITSLTGEISGCSTDFFSGNFVLNFFRCCLLFLARNHDNNASTTSKKPTKTRIQPAKNRDLNKRIAAKK